MEDEEDEDYIERRVIDDIGEEEEEGYGELEDEEGEIIEVLEDVDDEVETQEDEEIIEVLDEGHEQNLGEEFIGAWANLPDVCLRQVFSNLGDRDRGQAALVCHTWRHAMHTPALWRSRVFTFNGRISRRRPELETALSFIRAYGRHLKDVELRISHPLNSLVARRLAQAVRSFLSELRTTRCRLRSLSLNHMELDWGTWTSSVRKSLVRGLVVFLRREASHLCSLSLRGARLALPQGLEVLEAVAAAQEHTHLLRRPGIANLNLEDFFLRRLDVSSSPAFVQVMQRFQGLSDLTLNYSCVSNELLTALARSSPGSLRHLQLRCHVLEPHGQRIWPDAWAELTQCCPDLRVQLTVERILDTDQLGRILLKEVL